MQHIQAASLQHAHDLSMTRTGDLAGDMDNLGESNSGMLQVSISDFADTASEDALLSMKGGLKEFCGMGAAGRKEAMIVTLRDAFAGQSGMPASDAWVTVNSLGGQKKLELAKYLSMLAAMRPDAAECLSDGDCHPTSPSPSAILTPTPL